MSQIFSEFCFPKIKIIIDAIRRDFWRAKDNKMRVKLPLNFFLRSPNHGF
jgi:hypothetical protein